MRSRQLTDGVTTDSVSEFVFASSDTLGQLYSANPLGYQDALFKLLQVVGSSDAVLLPEHPMKTVYSEQLRELLRREGRLELLREDSRPDVSAIQTWVERHWQQINNTILRNHDLRAALSGFLRREFLLAFRQVVPGYDPRHYYPGHDVLVVPSDTKRILTNSVRDLAQERPRISSAVISDWIDAALTTHYRNFRWNWEASDAEYTPAYTREAAGVMDRDLGVEKDLVVVRHAAAVDILREVKRRTDLPLVALEWTYSKKGQLVREGYNHLRETLIQSDESERARHRTEMERILNSQLSQGFDAIFGIVGLVANLLTGKAPDERPSLVTSAGLRWLWKIRHPSASAELTDLVRRLVRS